MKKIIILALSIGLLAAVNGQQQPKQNFVRIFDADKKIYKGFILSTTDSAITIYRNHNYTTIAATRITTLKLKRSPGNPILISAIVFGTVGGVLTAIGIKEHFGEIFVNPNTPPNKHATEYTILGFSCSAGFGALIGAIISAGKSRPVFFINHDRNKWQKIRSSLQ